MSSIDSPNYILRYDPKSMRALFAPRSVAVIGASAAPDSAGYAVLSNLVDGEYTGIVHPVNRHYDELQGRQSYPAVTDIPTAVDLAVIATPPEAVPGIISQCAEKEVRSAVLLSGGFRALGDDGRAMKAEIAESAKNGRLRLVGPHSMGIMNPHTGLNVTPAPHMVAKGSVAFISQSSALSSAVLDWSRSEKVGFSSLVSVGGMMDVDWADLIYYFGDDYHTNSIVMYVETIPDVRSFLSAVREVALAKPIILIKPSRTAAVARAAETHTGALTGSDDVLDAALRRAGALRVSEMHHLFYMAETLSKQPRARGPRLAIVTNAGAPGVLATDALTHGGGKVASLTAETTAALDDFLPPTWSGQNPIDLLEDATPDIYGRATELALADENVDGVLVVLGPLRTADPVATAEQVVAVTADNKRKPVLASWMGGPSVRDGERVLNDGRIPTFSYPDIAAQVFNSMWRYSRNLQGLYETPSLPESNPADSAAHQAAADLLADIRADGRTILGEDEARRVLAAYGIPMVETRTAVTAAKAVSAAEKIGYPVAVKLHSEEIIHKTDVGGVHLNVYTADEVRHAFNAIAVAAAEYGAGRFLGVLVQPMADRDAGVELIVGCSCDPEFGPVIMFGQGGVLVEVLQDRALALPPLNTTLARRLMERTKIYRALQGVRGRAAVDLPALEKLLVRFSHLVAEQPWIREIDINPLLVTADGFVALDAEIVLHDPDTKRRDIPKPAIRPYPQQYVDTWTAQNGETLTIRPIRPEDEPLLVVFHQKLSNESVYLRYFQSLPYEQRVAHERLVRQCFIDYDREIALVMVRENEGADDEILAVGRLSKVRNADEAEFAEIVRDDAQGMGMGTELLRRLIEIGRREDIGQIVAYTLPENGGMKHIFRRMEFEMGYEDGMSTARLPLREAPTSG